MASKLSTLLAALPGKTPVATDRIPLLDSANSDAFQTTTLAALRGPLLTDLSYWDDLRTPGHAVRLSGGSPPDLVAGFAGNASLYSLHFNGSGSTTEEVFFDLQFPHTWKQGSVIYPHVHFSPASTNSADPVARVVRFVLDYTWANVHDTFGTVASYAMTASFIPNDALWQHLIASNSAGIDGSDRLISSVMKCRLYREPGHEDDTYPQDVAFNSFDIHFQVDSLGSASEYSK